MKKTPIYAVKWQDAVGNSNWHTKEDIKNKKLGYVYSIGVIARHDKKVCMVAGTLDKNSETEGHNG